MKQRMNAMSFWAILCSLVLLSSGCSRETPEATPEPAPDATSQVQQFESPELAVAAMAALIGAYDEAAIERMFGPGSLELLSSGDAAADAEDYQRVKAMIGTRVEFSELDDSTRIALIGEEGWPWPIPLVKTSSGWQFDLPSGREELLNRRVGRNELFTLAALHEYVNAQREYFSESRDGLSARYAQKFLSSPGTHDGLYWPPADEADISPMGDLLADAGTRYSSETPQPFHGYFYRILTAQGAAAAGGEASYLDENGVMTGGFAAIAWPARYGNSGVMTFKVNHRGIAFQKDLGADTETLAAQMDRFDPDASWSPTGFSARELD